MDFDVQTLDQLQKTLVDISGAISGWLATSDTTTWTGVTSAMSAAGQADRALAGLENETEWDKFEDPAIARLIHGLFSRNEALARDWLDVAEYYYAFPDYFDFDDDSGIFLGESYVKHEVESYEGRGYTNQRANDAVMTNLFIMAEEALKYAGAIRGELDEFNKLILDRRFS